MMGLLGAAKPQALQRLPVDADYCFQGRRREQKSIKNRRGELEVQT